VPELTITTLNLFNNRHGRWPERAPLVAAGVVALEPDVLCVQEVDPRSEQIAALVEAVNRGIPGDPYAAVTMPNPDPKSIKSLAVLTRVPVAAVAMLDDLGGGDIALRVGIEPAGGSRLEVFTTHLHYGPSAKGGQLRRRQAERLLSWMDAESQGRPHLVCGDFNARPEGDTVASVKRRLRSAHEVANGAEAAWTHPTPLVRSLDARLVFGIPELPEIAGSAVDYIFVSDAIEVLSASVAFDRPAEDDPSLYPSDHLGVTARIRL
jgi:endonuclease/exonuclease/phosphatase family metal-dependent hydrolase